MARPSNYKVISLTLETDLLKALDSQIWDFARGRAAYGQRSRYIENIIRNHLTSIGVTLNAATPPAGTRDCDL